MSGRRAAPRRRSRLPLGLLLAAALVTAAVVAVTLTVQRTADDQPASSEPTADAPPVAKADLSELPIARTSFCDRLTTASVEEALDGAIDQTDHYGDGDRAELSPGVRDIAHEFNCTYVASDGTRARVWVFAEAVTQGSASAMGQTAREEEGCEAIKAPGFGSPTAATVCTTDDPAALVVTLRGLFGDAWLSCEVSVPGAPTAQAVERTGSASTLSRRSAAPRPDVRRPPRGARAPGRARWPPASSRRRASRGTTGRRRLAE